ncbi:uncharacterized protein EKO05_0003988 [Ascochyta rabiei]|uniref:uncharacterized protein n=1 Tax=Didymella rabiei TaxID=5454 RepID=UPI0021FAB1CF|nr:uncharacterized protein EKO05_0003988 [Ascochyta rabiei]UPX13481.1 hypothetical protein EKO05_0003988 [Ascochyta rabiei]
MYMANDADNGEGEGESVYRSVNNDGREWFLHLKLDWSMSGRGSHADFGQREAFPLQEGHFLGKGSMGDVYTTVVHDYALAWKRVPLIRKMGQRYTKELAILKKLSHTHMIRLIGTYTYQQFLGLLLHLIAVCYLHTFFNDVEAYWSASADDTQKDRLERLHFCSQQPS